MEKFIDVPNYEGLYKISEKGEIYSINSRKLLKPVKGCVALSKYGVRKTYTVKNLISLALDNLSKIKDEEITYKKKYKEALEKAKDVYTYYCDDREQLEKIEAIFPELAESEDEKTKKELTEFLKQASGGFLTTTIKCKTFEKWLSWLEKQGNNKVEST